MGKLAKVCLFVVACLLSLTAQAQVAVISGQVIDQNGAPLPYAQVRVCSVTSTGVPCTPTASIYQDYGLSVPAANPTTTDQYGNYTVYAGTLPAPNLYTVQFSPTSGITWSYVVNGPFLSAAGGIVTGYITALGYNQVAEVDQFSGVDFVAKLDNAYNSLPASGVLDARGFVGTQTSTTLWTALTNPAKPALVLVGPGNNFTFNEVYSPGKIASGVSTGISGANGACIVPIGQGSAIVNEGGNYTSFWRVGPNAQTYDFFCNAAQDGTQESFRVSGLAIIGNQSAPLPGALLHDRRTFVGTYIDNNYIDLPFGTSVRVEGGSDQMLFNNTIQDSSTAGGYAGSVLDITCASSMQVIGGAIQFNGANNPLVTIQGTSPTMATSGCPLGANEEGLHFQGVDWEIQPATVGSFSGHATNVDVVQCTDCSDFLIDKLFLFGNKGAGQQHVVDFLSSGNNGQTRGTVEVNNLVAAVGSQWSGLALITNNATGFVSPQQASVIGKASGSTVGIGKYRWAGDGTAASSFTDYEDQKNFASMTALSTNGDIVANLQAGSDIGAQVNNALTQCTFQCQVFIPAGNYSFSTPIVLPIHVFGTYSLRGDPGAVLTYTGTGDAITASIATSGVLGSSKLMIEGFQLNGNSGAASGIHTYPTNGITIRNMLIQGFSTGDGIRVEGTNSSQIYDNLIQNNLNGVHLIPTYCTTSAPYSCSGTGSGSPFTPNALHIDHNQITSNVQWGIWDDRNNVTGGLTGSLGNEFCYNDLELNGLNTSVYGALYVMHSTGDLVCGNYFEGSPREVVLGELSAGSALDTAGPVVRDNFFTTKPPVSPATKAYNIELQNTVDALIEGNSEQGTSGIGSATNCFMNAATSGETRTVVGRNAIFQNSTDGSGNQICSNGSGVLTLPGAGSFTIFNANYQAYVGFQNFQINTTVTSESVGVQNMTSNGSCQLARSTGHTAAVIAGGASILAGTFYVDTVGAGGITVVHPSGTAMTVDILCENSPIGGYGVP